MHNFYRALFFIGTSEDNSSEINRTLIVSNKMSIMFGVLTMPLLCLFNISGYRLQGSLIVLLSLGFFFCVFLNYIKFHIVSKFLLVLISNIAIYFYSSILGEDVGIQSLYFGMFCLPLVLFDASTVWIRRFLMAVPVFLSIYYEIFGSFGFKILPLQKDVSLVSFFLVHIITFIIIAFTIRGYFNLKEAAEGELVDTVENLKKKNRELKGSEEIQKEMMMQAAYARLVNGIAHEIKNPLQMLRGRAEIMLENFDDKNSVISFSNSIIKNVDRLNRIVKPMLTYGSLGKTYSVKEFFLVKEMVDELVDLSSAKLKTQKIGLKTDVDDFMQVFGVKDYIYQAILNLVLNAIEHSIQGGTISIILKKETYIGPNGFERSGAVIKVVDTGSGMEADVLENIFDPYFTSKSNGVNVGLGLSIVYRIATENNGVIKAESEIGVGSTFSLFLPTDDKE
ncbi:HAMP domain-containing histidine kinase [bacterium]|jgi:signal transduction histidine kinase|nr:HAMP domain-containing histidine kinase [bacterium]